jgi:hypothetical protein
VKEKLCYNFVLKNGFTENREKRVRGRLVICLKLPGFVSHFAKKS